MPQFYKIDKECRLVLSSASGVFSRADAAGHMEKLLKDPDFNPSCSQIADFTQVTRIELSAQDIHELAQRSVFSRLSRRALIVPMTWPTGLAGCLKCFDKTMAKWGSAFFATSATL